MPNKEIKAQVKENTKKLVEAAGMIFDEETWKRAVAKEERWMKGAYGSIDWQERIDEAACDETNDFDCFTYYKESIIKAAPGQTTFNRKNLNRVR